MYKKAELHICDLDGVTLGDYPPEASPWLSGPTSRWV
jgi:hypothetical protein